MVQDQGGISGRVARYGDGILQLLAGLTEKRASWLVAWLREKIQAGNVTAWGRFMPGFSA